MNDDDDDDLMSFEVDFGEFALNFITIMLFLVGGISMTAGLLATIFTDNIGYFFKGIIGLIVSVVLGLYLPVIIFTFVYRERVLEIPARTHEAINEEDKND